MNRSVLADDESFRLRALVERRGWISGWRGQERSGWPRCLDAQVQGHPVGLTLPPNPNSLLCRFISDITAEPDDDFGQASSAGWWKRGESMMPRRWA